MTPTEKTAAAPEWEQTTDPHSCDECGDGIDCGDGMRLGERILCAPCWAQSVRDA